MVSHSVLGFHVTPNSSSEPCPTLAVPCVLVLALTCVSLDRSSVAAHALATWWADVTAEVTDVLYLQPVRALLLAPT